MHNVLVLFGKEYVLRDVFFLDIDETGQLTVTLDDLFESAPAPFAGLLHVVEMLQENAQLVANRGQGRGVPMNEFKIRVKQEFFITMERDNWRFTPTLVYMDGEEVYDDNN